jgi:type II secretory pathway predicted ATPase ExeA
MDQDAILLEDDLDHVEQGIRRAFRVTGAGGGTGAGTSRPLFTDSTITQIYSISRGSPRVINNLCTAYLLDVEAHAGQEVANVQRVQLDFEQL